MPQQRSSEVSAPLGELRFGNSYDQRTCLSFLVHDTFAVTATATCVIIVNTTMLSVYGSIMGQNAVGEVVVLPDRYGCLHGSFNYWEMRTMVLLGGILSSICLVIVALSLLTRNNVCRGAHVLQGFLLVAFATSSCVMVPMILPTKLIRPYDYTNFLSVFTACLDGLPIFVRIADITLLYTLTCVGSIFNCSSTFKTEDPSYFGRLYDQAVTFLFVWVIWWSEQSFLSLWAKACTSPMSTLSWFPSLCALEERVMPIVAAYLINSANRTTDNGAPTTSMEDALLAQNDLGSKPHSKGTSTKSNSSADTDASPFCCRTSFLPMSRHRKLYFAPNTALLLAMSGANPPCSHRDSGGTTVGGSVKRLRSPPPLLLDQFQPSSRVPLAKGNQDLSTNAECVTANESLGSRTIWMQSEWDQVGHNKDIDSVFGKLQSYRKILAIPPVETGVSPGNKEQLSMEQQSSKATTVEDELLQKLAAAVNINDSCTVDALAAFQRAVHAECAARERQRMNRDRCYRDADRIQGTGLHLPKPVEPRSGGDNQDVSNRAPVSSQVQAGVQPSRRASPSPCGMRFVSRLPSRAWLKTPLRLFDASYHFFKGAHPELLNMHAGPPTRSIVKTFRSDDLEAQFCEWNLYNFVQHMPTYHLNVIMASLVLNVIMGICHSVKLHYLHIITNQGVLWTVSILRPLLHVVGIMVITSFIRQQVLTMHKSPWVLEMLFIALVQLNVVAGALDFVLRVTLGQQCSSTLCGVSSFAFAAISAPIIFPLRIDIHLYFLLLWSLLSTFGMFLMNQKLRTMVQLQFVYGTMAVLVYALLGSRDHIQRQIFIRSVLPYIMYLKEINAGLINEEILTSLDTLPYKKNL